MSYIYMLVMLSVGALVSVCGKVAMTKFIHKMIALKKIETVLRL